MSLLFSPFALLSYLILLANVRLCLLIRCRAASTSILFGSRKRSSYVNCCVPAALRYGILCIATSASCPPEKVSIAYQVITAELITTGRSGWRTLWFSKRCNRTTRSTLKCRISAETRLAAIHYISVGKLAKQTSLVEDVRAK